MYDSVIENIINKMLNISNLYHYAYGVGTCFDIHVCIVAMCQEHPINRRIKL
jgi:hypothetical protein